MKRLTLLLTAAIIFVTACAPAPPAGIPEYSYQVVHTYPHDPHAFTEGLFFEDGFLYESTGLNGQSDIRKEKLETGEVLQSRTLSSQYFGEGIVKWKDRLIELTYQTEVGFVYDFATLNALSQFKYPGEGWALTHDDKRIIMDDGTPQVRFWNPDTLAEIGRVTVNQDGRPIQYINELEYVKGEVYANIWQTDRIVRFDPNTGNVVGWIDLTGILPAADRVDGPNGTDVLNGIAYDAKGDRLFVTGKRWPKLFEIKLIKKS